MYLFKPRSSSTDAPSTGAETAVLNATPFDEVLPLNSAAIQPGSAAEWAIGELLIRLCNRGRALRPDPPETPTLE